MIAIQSKFIVLVLTRRQAGLNTYLIVGASITDRNNFHQANCEAYYLLQMN